MRRVVGEGAIQIVDIILVVPGNDDYIIPLVHVALYNEDDLLHDKKKKL